MAMVFCRACGKEIHSSASACPHCGAAQATSKVGRQGTKWMATTSFALGILAVLATMSILAEGGTAEEVLGVIMLALISVVFAVISFAQKHWGKGLSIAGIVLSAISALVLIGA